MGARRIAIAAVIESMFTRVLCDSVPEARSPESGLLIGMLLVLPKTGDKSYPHERQWKSRYSKIYLAKSKKCSGLI